MNLGLHANTQVFCQMIYHVTLHLYLCVNISKVYFEIFHGNSKSIMERSWFLHFIHFLYYLRISYKRVFFLSHPLPYSSSNSSIFYPSNNFTSNFKFFPCPQTQSLLHVSYNFTNAGHLHEYLHRGYRAYF